MKLVAVFVLSLFAVGFASSVHGQITSNVFERVLFVRVNATTDREATATAFTVDVDGRQYLITAKHVVQGLKDKDTLEIFINNKWAPLALRIFRCEDPIDIAVLVPPRQLTVDFELPFEKPDVLLGQEAYFLGFPYGIQQAAAPNLTGPYPLALTKRGLFSAQIVMDQAKHAVMLLLDGYNNPGFSGGPIVYHDNSQSPYVLKVLGVVSGFIPEVVPAMKEHDIKSAADASVVAKEQPWRIRKRNDGTIFEYVNDGTSVALNTGIVQGFSIIPAIELIRQHPVGPEVRHWVGDMEAVDH